MMAAQTSIRRDPATPLPQQLAVWEFAGLMLTYGCSARCAFCYVSSGPEHRDWMAVDAALAMWRSLDELAAAHGKTMRIHLAGGEPFGDWTRLVNLIRRARDAGLTPLEKVETNASWATHDGRTRARMELLDALGMEKLVVSTDVFHQQYVPFERVRRCVETARRVLGPGRVRVRWWDFYNDPVDTKHLPPADRDRAFTAHLTRHRERLTGRAAVTLPQLLPRRPAEAFAGMHCTREVLHSKHVHIDPYGHVFPGTCAGIVLGRATPTTSVKDVWHDLAANWRTHPIVSAVVQGGSCELMQRARPLGYQPLAEGYASKCHLCTHVRQFLLENHHHPAHVGPRECYDTQAGPPPAQDVEQGAGIERNTTVQPD